MNELKTVQKPAPGVKLWTRGKRWKMQMRKEQIFSSDYKELRIKDHIECFGSEYNSGGPPKFF